MGKGDIRDLKHGRETWKLLEHAMQYGRHSRDRVFRDWLEMILLSNLSITDNIGKPDLVEKLKENKLTGPYEERYLELVKPYSEGEKGKRSVDYMAEAWAAVQRATHEHQADVLGEMFEAMISFGEHGQFFTPEHMTDMMASLSMGAVVKDDGKPLTVLDPACGSGRMILSAAKITRDCTVYGVDLDGRCARMAAVNMLLFDLRAVIREGDSLAMTFEKEWRIEPGGFIYERDLRGVKDVELPKQGQQELFAA